MIPRRGVKIKFFLSVVIYVVKAALVPFSARGRNPANAGVARLCGVSPYPVPDTATALPKQARYQLRYTRLFRYFIRLGVFSQIKRDTTFSTIYTAVIFSRRVFFFFTAFFVLQKKGRHRRALPCR